jgi:hypothetical protein
MPESAYREWQAESSPDRGMGAARAQREVGWWDCGRRGWSGDRHTRRWREGAIRPGGGAEAAPGCAARHLTQAVDFLTGSKVGDISEGHGNRCRMHALQGNHDELVCAWQSGSLLSVSVLRPDLLFGLRGGLPE